MNPWSINPIWQNFSSLYREVVAAQEAKSEIGKYHHLMSKSVQNFPEFWGKER